MAKQTTQWAKFAAVSCTHCPYQSEPALERLLVELKSRRDLTHFIHLGDIIEGDASSVHASDPAGHTLYDEYVVAADMLRRIRECLPADCKLIAFDGNHDDNVQRQDPRRIDYSLRDLCDPRKMEGVKDEYKRWRRIPYRHGKVGTYNLGGSNVIFAHGFATGANSDELESIQLAMSAHGKLVNQLVIRGHTHRPVPPTQAKRSARIKLPLWFANTGYMAFEDRQSYTNRFSIDQWSRAAIFGEAQIGRVGRMGRDSWRATLVSLDG